MKAQLLFSLSAIFLFAAEATAGQLVHRYAFDKNFSDSVGGIDGMPTIEGLYTVAPSFSDEVPAGRTGASVDLGGVADKRSGVAFARSLISPEPGSLSLWVYPREKSGRESAQFIFLAPQIKTGITVVVPQNRSGLQTKVGDSPNLLVSDASLIGRWSHLALTWDGEGKVCFFLNGVLAQEDTYDPASLVFLHPARLGAFILADRAAHMETQFDGLVHDLRVYRGAISAEEVKSLYSGESE